MPVLRTPLPDQTSARRERPSYAQAIEHGHRLADELRARDGWVNGGHVAHYLWRELVEYEAFTWHEVVADLRGVPAAVRPGEGPPAGGLARPLDPRQWFGNFLATPGHELAKAEIPMMRYWALAPANREGALRRYRDQGYTHLPISWHETHIGGWHLGPERFRDELVWLTELGIEPCPFLFGAADGWHSSLEEMRRVVARYVPVLAPVVRLIDLGWEPDDTIYADEILDPLARDVRDIVGPSVAISWHTNATSRDRWSPDYARPYFDRREVPARRFYASTAEAVAAGVPEAEVDAKNELDFWNETTINMCLKQYPPDLPIAQIVESLFGWPGDAHGGLVGRLHRHGKRIHLFEFARTWERWEAGRLAIARDPRVGIG